MADFCKQCSIELFGEDYRDLAGMGRAAQGEPETLTPGYGWVVLCEDCGPTRVDDEGGCLGGCLNPKHDNPPTKG